MHLRAEEGEREGKPFPARLDALRLCAHTAPFNAKSTVSRFSWRMTMRLVPFQSAHCLLPTRAIDFQPVRLVVNDRKFLAKTVFFSHIEPASSNNQRSYTIVSVPAEQADCYWIFALPVLLNHASIINSVGVSSEYICMVARLVRMVC